MTKITIIAAVVDVYNLILYKQDGTTVLIPQGDARLQPILDVALSKLKKLGDTAEVDLAETQHYAEFEKKTGGLVKLFRVAKSKVAEFFGKTEAAPVKPITLGIVPSAKDVPAMTAVVTKRTKLDENGEVITPLASAVADIMSHAVPVSDKAFSAPSEKNPDEPDTIIAVVGGQVIPDVAALKPQMAAAVLRPNATTKGMENFLSRLAKVMNKRRHSVEDLMKFMQKGDLPIADDGCIVIYKILKRHRTLKDTFVDCHSGNVPQKVGSYVHMDENLVDPDRRNECSNGLHVARRGYLHGFSGDVVVLAKVAPEDVIAVPTYDANKMRVCGYHILALLSQESFRTLRDNKPMTDNTEDQRTLGAVLAGNHVAVLERVKITAAKGGGIQITPVGNAPVAPASTEERLAEALPDNGHLAAPVDVKEVAKAVTAKKEELYKAPPAGMDVKSEPLGEATPPPAPAEAKPVKKLSLKDVAGQLYQAVLSTVELEQKQAHAAALVLFKKEKKKSWADLGIGADEASSIITIAQPALPTKGAIFTDDKSVAKAQAQVDVAAGFPKAKPSNDDKMIKVSLPDRAKQLMYNVIDGSKESAKELLELKKTSKKSWDYLGVSEAQVTQIKELAK